LRESLALIEYDGSVVGEGCWEPWRWISHGGLSLCPYRLQTFGLLPDIYDFKLMASATMKARHPNQGFNVLSEDHIHPHSDGRR
jgi:hypothetical protein